MGTYRNSTTARISTMFQTDLFLPDFQDFPIRREKEASPSNEKMEIAFRYNHMRSLQDKKSQRMFLPSSHGRVEKEEVEKFNIDLKNVEVLGPEDAFNKLKKLSCDDRTSSKAVPYLIIFDNIDPSRLPSQTTLGSFIYLLKSSTRNISRSLVLLSYQSLFLLPEARKRVHNLADAYFCIESLESSDYGEEFKALFHVIKMPSKPKSLVSELGITIRKVKKHRCYSMEKLSIPPEGGNTPSRLQPTLNSIDIF